MKTIRLAYFILISYLSLIAQEGYSQSLQTWGGAGNDALMALEKTLDGGYLGLLFYEQSCSLGNSSYQSAGAHDFLLFRQDAQEQISWVVPISSSGSLELEGFEAQEDGSGYVLFQSSTPQSWNGQVQNAPAYSSILYAWDTQGQLRWSYAWHSHLFQRFSGITTDGASVYVGGYFSDSLHCVDSSWAAAGMESPFVARLSQDGQWQWGGSLAHKATATVQIQALAHLDGQCYVAGDFVDSLFLPTDTLYAAGADPDIFLLRYDSLGQITQSQSFNGTLADHVRQLEADGQRNKLYLGGEMQGLLRFGNTQLATAIQAYDAFLAQIDSSGQVDWAKKTYAEANNYSTALAIGENRIWQTGYFLDSFWVEGQTLQAQAGFDGYVLSWDSTGQLQTALSVSGDGTILPECVIGKTNGDWALGGSFDQTWMGQLSAGGSDAFLLEWNSPLPTVQRPLPPLIDLQPFPNPSRDTVHLALGDYQLHYWQLFDSGGRLVQTGESLRLDLSELPKGIYSLFIHLKEGLAIEKLQRN